MNKQISEYDLMNHSQSDTARSIKKTESMGKLIAQVHRYSDMYIHERMKYFGLGRG